MAGTTHTRKDVRQYLYEEMPQLGLAGTADSVAATSITDTYAFKDSGLGSNHFKGTTIYRPTTSGDDQVKKAGTVATSTGALSHTGSNYSDTSELYYELVGYLHPDDLNACIQRALRKTFFETQTVLTQCTDGDMESSGTSHWTRINGDETVAKETTAANIFSGLQSLSVANATANGGVKSDAITVQTSEPIRVSVICKITSGTANLIIYDETNSVVLETISTSERGWVNLYWQNQVGSTTKSITIRLVGVESSADIIWDNVIFYHMNARNMIAPSSLDEAFKLLKIRQVQYRVGISDGVQDAVSRQFMDWTQPQHFSLDVFQPEANSYVIEFNRPIVGDLWIEYQRPYYDLETFSDDTGTSSAPFLQLVAYTKYELALLLKKRYPTDPQWEDLRVLATDEIKAETLSRPEIPDTPKKVYLLGRI